METKLQLDTGKPPGYMAKIKYLRWWSQSFISGVNKIIVGKRNTNGFVQEKPDIIEVSTLPFICVSVLISLQIYVLITFFCCFFKEQGWKPKVCFRFLDEFLQKLQRFMSKIDCENTVYEFKFEPSKNKIFYKKLDEQNCIKVIHPSFVKFLKEDF